VERLAHRHEVLVLAESCTAGLVADLVARVSGASAVLWGSFVCYTADAKERMLGIDGELLRRYALVSREAAREMALQALELSGMSIAAAVTGLAGPDGDGSATAVGTVWVAVARRGNFCGVADVWHREKELHFQGTRAEIRIQAALAVVEELLKVRG
jgi:PncC family amidohydrolase